MDLTDSLRVLDGIPDAPAYGIISSCLPCFSPWDRRQRELYLTRLSETMTEWSRLLRTSLRQKQITGERHFPVGCSITLRYPIDYMGVQTKTLVGEYDVCYTRAVKCGGAVPAKDDPCAVMESYIGYADIPALPEGVTADMLHYEYSAEEARNTRMVLGQPEADLGYCDVGQAAPEVQAVWLKYRLAKPSNRKTRIDDDNNFISSVRVYAVATDDTNAITPIGECACAVCSAEPDEITFEIIDAPKGIICVRGLCASRQVAVNYGTAIGHNGAIPDDLKRAISLLLLIKLGQQFFCDCDPHKTTLRHWLETDPDSQKPLVTPGMLPFGGSRAGMEAARIYATYVREPDPGNPDTVAGMFSARTRNFRKVWH